MWGAIAGDIIGSSHEFRHPPTKTPDFHPLFASDCQFTDDTILTIATASALLDSKGSNEAPDYESKYLDWGRRYPSSYGGRFAVWLNSQAPRPYGSFGNGSAMRVSPIGWAFDSLDATLEHARLTALPTHNHPEGIKGAQAVAHAIYCARNGSGKDEIRRVIGSRYGYDLNRTIDEIRPGYRFDETCQRTVPEAIIAFLESEGFESAVRLSISLGGDADTLACIAGSIAEAHHGGLPVQIARRTRSLIPSGMRDIVDRFDAEFIGPRLRAVDQNG